jgi:hypothetical protein
MGHVMVTASVDFALWAALLYAVIRALLRDEPRWWLVAGAVVGVSLYNKLLISMLLIGLAAGLLLVGPRLVLRSRWLWAGVGLAVLIGLPNLIYQATHDFPQLTMAGALSENNAGEVRATLLPFQFLLIAPTLAAVWIAGVVALFRRPQWRPVRAVAVAYLAALVITFVGGGQIYYAFGLQAVMLAAGWVPTVDWMRTRVRKGLVYAALALGAVVTVLLALPVLPVRTFGQTPIPEINQAAQDSVGWPEYVATVRAVYDGLTPEQRARAVVLGSNYGEAGALAHFGFHDVYSGHNQLWFEGAPPETATVAVIWTQNPRFWGQVFQQCDQRATIDNGVGVDNEEQGSAVVVCEGPIGGWAAIWPRLLHYD